MKKNIFACICATLMLSFLINTSAYACDCYGLTLAQQCSTSNGIFIGKVIAINSQQLHSPFIYTNDPLFITFTISQKLKGNLSDTATIATYANPVSCGYYFQLDSEYLIFSAKKPLYDSNYSLIMPDSLTTDFCSGNLLINDAKNIIDSLKTLGIRNYSRYICLKKMEARKATLFLGDHDSHLILYSNSSNACLFCANGKRSSQLKFDKKH